MKERKKRQVSPKVVHSLHLQPLDYLPFPRRWTQDETVKLSLLPSLESYLLHFFNRSEDNTSANLRFILGRWCSVFTSGARARIFRQASAGDNGFFF